MNPDPLTLRHLDWMAQGKQKAMWDHTCEIIATLVNLHRERGKPAISGRKLHPLRRQSTGMSFTVETLRDISTALKAKEEREGNHV